MSLRKDALANLETRVKVAWAKGAEGGATREDIGLRVQAFAAETAAAATYADYDEALSEASAFAAEILDDPVRRGST